MIWNTDAECMDQEAMRALQLERFKAQLNSVYERVPYYAEKMKKARIAPESISSCDDIRTLPFTVKNDLRKNYPFKTFQRSLKDVVRVHASTGTTGKPTVVGYTRGDMDTWTEVVARFLVAGGLTDEDIVQIAFGYGLFTGGFGLHYGAERVGATVIPAASGNTDRQLMLMQDLGTTALVCTPSYAVYMGEHLAAQGIDPSDLPLRVGFFGGEFWTDVVRNEIEASLGISATDNYGLSEIIGPGVCGECQEKQGMHIAEDHFFVEIIDPETLQPVPDGEMGEVVITSMTKEAFPVIRYRTRDISRLIVAPCACGRTTKRLEKVLGRTDDMLIIKGVNVFPSQVEHALHEFQGAKPHYQLVVYREGSKDSLEVKVEISKDLFYDEMKKLTQVKEKLKHTLESTLGLHIKLTLAEPGSLERFEGKAKRVVDLRTVEAKRK